MAYDLGQAMQGFPMVPGGSLQTYAVPPAMMEVNPAPAAQQQPLGIKQRIGALFQDPDFNKSLIAFGANLMMSPQRGENLGDVFGKSLMAGMGTYQGLKDKKKAEGAAETKMQKDDQREAARAGMQQQQIDLSRQELEQRRADSAQRKASDDADRISRENIAKISANARGQGGTGGGMSAIEFAFGEAKKAYISAGFSEPEAQQRATKDVILSQKTPSEGSLAQQRYNRAVDIATDAWMRNPESLMANPQQAAQAIHAMASELARAAVSAQPGFEGAAPPPGGNTQPGNPLQIAPGSMPTATPPGQVAPAEPAAIVPPAPTKSGGRGGPGRGTQTAPYSAQEAQAAANAMNKPIKVWVVNPATGQAANVTVTPDAKPKK